MMKAQRWFGNVQPVSISYYPNFTPYYKAGFLSISGIDARYSLDVAGNIGKNGIRFPFI